MSTREKLIKARLGMLALAEELQNISLVCRKAGISRGLTLLFCCSSRCLCLSFPSSRMKPLFENGEFVGRDV